MFIATGRRGNEIINCNAFQDGMKINLTKKIKIKVKDDLFALILC